MAITSTILIILLLAPNSSPVLGQNGIAAKTSLPKDRSDVYAQFEQDVIEIKFKDNRQMRLSEGVPQDANRGAVSATETVALMAPAAGGAWQPSDVGLYRAVAANSAREVTSSVATLAIADEPVANTVVFINEVHYRSSGSEDWVEFINTGSETIDIGDWWLCARFKYGKINTLPLIVGSGYVLDPGEILVVRAHTDLDNNASDLGLYTSDDFTSATAMVDFVQWGAGRRTF